MSQDFFLLNRAHQITRLCVRPECAVPLVKNRRQLPQQLAEWYGLIDEICAIAKQATEQPAFALSPSQRRRLIHSERLIVQLRFSADERVKQPAVQWIRAIFADAEYFSGLKPLPQYTERFAYETLFPSWLNLLSALMLPDKVSGKLKLDGRQQGALFEFLSSYAVRLPEQEVLAVSYLTMLANRLAAEECEPAVQRLVDMLNAEDSGRIEAIENLHSTSRDALEFMRKLREYLAVRYCYSPPVESRVAIAGRRPPTRSLPAQVQARLETLESQREWDAYFDIAEPLACLIESRQPLAVDMAAVLQAHPERSGELLAMIRCGAGKIAGMTTQHAAARLSGELLGRNPHACLRETEQFVRWLASRVELFPETIGDRFCEKLGDENCNWRASLLTHALADQGSGVEGGEQSDFTDACLTRAAAASENVTSIEWLSYAAAFNANKLLREGCFTLGALLGVIENRSIGGKELSDLMGDLQANPTAGLATLASPLMSLAGKSQRLASLYLTLNDVAETYRSTGTYGNFSVVRARYSVMTRHDADENPRG